MAKVQSNKVSFITNGSQKVGLRWQFPAFLVQADGLGSAWIMIDDSAKENGIIKDSSFNFIMGSVSTD
ncbi:hypothetical protein [Paenibacillus lautus]|uniref:hypothetical protein n=1 Tax=Paenibacillus lautus TaxID=1401 RepID=UPI003D272F9D